LPRRIPSGSSSSRGGFARSASGTPGCSCGRSRRRAGCSAARASSSGAAAARTLKRERTGSGSPLRIKKVPGCRRSEVQGDSDGTIVFLHHQRSRGTGAWLRILISSTLDLCAIGEFIIGQTARSEANFPCGSSGT
jgi:hypothetical protein